MSELKDYRKKEIPMLLLGNILLMIYINGVFSVELIQGDGLNLLLSFLNSAVLSSFLYLFTMILDGIFSSETKDKLVYLFFGRIPGEKVFTTIKKKDNDIRFSYKDLYGLYPEIYDNLPQQRKECYKYENETWYNIYRQYKTDNMIYNSHKEALMFRDMYCLNILIIAIYCIFSLYINVVEFNRTYFMLLCFFTALFNFVTRNKAKRFVYNVIAIAISNNRREN